VPLRGVKVCLREEDTGHHLLLLDEEKATRGLKASF
jgi:hypothetical protein